MKILLALAGIVLLTGNSIAQRPPNILFIYTDDQSYRTVGCYPEAFDWVTTPNIDSLARSGVRFDHAYIGSWCMPSRATLLTGHHQHGIESMRMEGEYPGSEYDADLCPFWPSIFRARGYSTAHIGKWHTGTDAGFGRDWDYQMVWNRPRFPENAPYYYDNQLISKNGGEAQLVTGYSTDNYTDWAVDYIGDQRGPNAKPWYLWLCYGAVHGPFTPAERHLNGYSAIEVPVPTDVYPPRAGKPEYSRTAEFWKRGPDGGPVERKVRDKPPVGMKDFPGRSLKEWVRQYHQGVLAIDEGVGRLLQALKETGQDDNTLIVFTSDQGFAWGQHGMKSKVAPYRATVEAPLIIRPPAKAAKRVAGKVVKTPVSGVDLPPTFFAQAGIELPWEMHGHDLSPLLASRESTWNHPAMLVHTGKKYGSDTDHIPAKGDPDLYHGAGIPWYVMLADGRYKYVRNLIEGETEELYDMEADPEELHNLVQDGKHASLLKRLRADAIEELRRTDAGMVDDLPTVATDLSNAADKTGQDRRAIQRSIDFLLAGQPGPEVRPSDVLRRLTQAGLKTQGRDPLQGTGLCGPLLPVNGPADVHCITLPRDALSSGDLLLIDCFPNLQQVRSQRPVRQHEDRLIRSSVPDGTWLLYDVRSDDGEVLVQTTRRKGYQHADEDLNGDGVVDADDLPLGN